jgi:hypothetical protein
MQQPQVPINVPVRSGIIFGPGRATRMPDPGTPEYKQLVERMRTAVEHQK